MEATPPGPDLQGKVVQWCVPPGGSIGRTIFTGARRAGSGPAPDAHVIALRQYAHHDPNETDEHHQGTSNWQAAVLVFR